MSVPKRSREDDRQVEAEALMLLSRFNNTVSTPLTILNARLAISASRLSKPDRNELILPILVACHVPTKCLR
ncbi:hypothetical protein KY284_008727 [Solanum tuberosum]|nr:hypothetical protein KY284_008727 [Solanum tuberosum]